MLQNILEPFVGMIVERVAERVKQLEDAKEPRYYSREEVAQILHVSLPALHSYVKRGLLSPKRVGRRVLFDAQAVDEAVASHRVYKHMKGGAR